jgi:ABC-2 type transport system ATP-binding protein
MSLVISNVSHRYASAASDALNEASLTIPTASIFGLLGPNGAGKSTLLSILNGLIPMQRGKIEIDGMDLAQQAAKIKAISALVPQEFAFYPSLTTRENLRFFAGVYAVPRDELAKRLQFCLDVCRLHEVLDRRAEHYSGGVKRRLNLAIGLLNAPRVLYLDEPTVGIDAESRQCIFDAIRMLKNDGTTIIYTSHYMEEVEAICDALAIIDRGRVLIQDEMHNLLQRSSAHQLHISLRVDATLDAIADFVNYRPVSAGEMRWLLQIPHGLNELPAALSVFEKNNIDIAELHWGVNPLEQVYLDLLKSAVPT